jgi:CDP-glycerol glycerophosphotransferase
VNPRISVIVPIYNVDRYLDACLRSLAQQTVSDLEIIMVDDGSTDTSPDIARSWESRDPRFRLISKPNGGLGSARNAGIAGATGEYLAFVDADDLIPRHGYELLLDSLLATGSDIAAGNVDRFSEHGDYPVRFLTDTFARRRRKTHLSRFRPLLADRMVTNKLWRRSFWDANAFVFPEGVLHEDIGVALRGHLLAGTVDLISKPVYLWRIRAGGDLSITQRRTEIDSFRHRMAAVNSVRATLDELGPRRVVRWYDASVLRDDFALHLKVLDVADDDYRREVVETLGEYAKHVSPNAFKQLSAIDRLIWHLVRRGLVSEVVEVVHFEKHDLPRTPPVRVGDRWYGDFPFRTDAALAVPDDVFELRTELSPVAVLDELSWSRAALRRAGHAYISQLGAPNRRGQRLRLTAQSMAKPWLKVPLYVRRQSRPDATADSHGIANLDWSGFRAVLPRALLRLGGVLGAGEWQLRAGIKTQGVGRSTTVWESSPLLLGRVAESRLGPDRVMRATLSGENEVKIDVGPELPSVRTLALVDGSLRIEGSAGHGLGLLTGLQVSRRAGSAIRTYPVSCVAGAFHVDLPVSDLVKALDIGDEQSHIEDADDGVTWSIRVVARDGNTYRLSLDPDRPTAHWPLPGDREIAASATSYGRLYLVERSIRPLIAEAHWTADDRLVLSGRFSGQPGRHRAVVAVPRLSAEHRIPLEFDNHGGFTVTLAPAEMPGRFGSLPLEPGWWRLYLDRVDAARSGRVPFAADQAFLRQLPMTRSTGRGTFSLIQAGASSAALASLGDLSVRERGAANQHFLQTRANHEGRSASLRDTITYLSFDGRQFSDSPRALYRELVERKVRFEHQWVVWRGQCDIDSPGVTVAEGSEKYYDAMSTSRFIITTGPLPGWFVARPDQVVLLTWHGHPLKKIGLDVGRKRFGRREDDCSLRRQARSWSYLLSPSSLATPVLAKALAFQGPLLETGLPRTDVLFGPTLAERAAAVRDRIGIPTGKRVVLYMPTYRDQWARGGGRFALSPHIDLELMRRELSEDHVLLFRKHHSVVGSLLAEPDEFVVDVSGYPDATELLLAADVLVTDYSSVMFDWMSTGRPIIYFVPDLVYYRDELRGFYFDLEAQGPGPFVESNRSLVDAIRSVDETALLYRARYEAFRSMYCPFDDGHAAARVVDALLRG